MVEDGQSGRRLCCERILPALGTTAKIFYVEVVLVRIVTTVMIQSMFCASCFNLLPPVVTPYRALRGLILGDYSRRRVLTLKIKT